MDIDTILFDLDGTLINTNELIIASFLHTLGTYYPNEYTRDHIIPVMGMPLVETFKELGVKQLDRIDDYVMTYRDFNISNHEKYVHAFEGVLDTIAELSKNKFKLGIVTTKNAHTVNLGLELTNLKPYFSTIVTIDDVDNPKPHPEPIIKALKQLDSNPTHTMMVGDSRYDIESGKNAGVTTAGVAWTIRGKEYLASFSPNYMLENMPDLLRILGVKPA